jgi:hypothetical protein
MPHRAVFVQRSRASLSLTAVPGCPLSEKNVVPIAFNSSPTLQIAARGCLPHIDCHIVFRGQSALHWRVCLVSSDPATLRTPENDAL